MRISSNSEGRQMYKKIIILGPNTLTGPIPFRKKRNIRTLPSFPAFRRESRLDNMISAAVSRSRSRSRSSVVSIQTPRKIRKRRSTPPSFHMKNPKKEHEEHKTLETPKTSFFKTPHFDGN